MSLRQPSNKLIASYIDKFDESARYTDGDNAIIKLFNAFPQNNNVEEVLLKISVINDLYSTQIYDTHKMALHIASLGIDDALIKGDPGAVDRIAYGHGIRSGSGEKDIHFYSFATKYCNWHNMEGYTIFDSYVEKILWAYQKRFPFSEFRRQDLRDFEVFKKVVLDFIQFYDLTNYNLKEIDKFLWWYGKEMFPSYGPKASKPKTRVLKKFSG